MITWTRLLGGGVRDPQVGRHLLIGVALGIGFLLFTFVAALASDQFNLVSYPNLLKAMLDTRGASTQFLLHLTMSIGSALGLLFLFSLLRALLRSQWIAAATFALLFLFVAAANRGVIAGAFGAIYFGLVIFCLIRFGVLPMAAALFVNNVLIDFPLTADFSVWYASSTIFILVVVLALTTYAFHTAVAGQPVFNAGFFDTD